MRQEGLGDEQQAKLQAIGAGGPSDHILDDAYEFVFVLRRPR